MYSYYVQKRRFCLADVASHPVIGAGVVPVLYYGDNVVFNLTFPAETFTAGDIVTLAVDVDKDFINTSPLAIATITLDEAAEQVEFTLPCRTARFRDIINGKNSMLMAYLQVTRWRTEQDDIVGHVLCDEKCVLCSLVSDYGADVDVLPKPIVVPVPSPEDSGKVIAVKDNGEYGLEDIQGGGSAQQATDAEIDARESTTHAITPNNLNYSVVAALTDANKISLTDAQKASAQDTLGAAPATLHLDAAPTTSTVGAFGQRAIVDATGKAYTCTAVTVDETDPENPVTTYTWRDDVNVKGGMFTGQVAFENSVLFGPTTGGGARLRIRSSNGNLNAGGNSQTGDYSVSACYGAYNYAVYSLTAGYFTQGGVFSATASTSHRGLIIGGEYNIQDNVYLSIGIGTSESNRRDGIELNDSGNLNIAGGYEQQIVAIPAATTAYMLSEGVLSHAPEAASTYTLPAIDYAFVADGRRWRRSPSNDATGAYAWQCGGNGYKRYTASVTPVVGDNIYLDTALTQGAQSITAIDTRTHECILTVRFSSSVLTYAFEDSAGNHITPLPLAGTIADGSVVAFRCTWEALLNQWVIMPVMLGTYTEVTP